jgi:SulP family sulfate permease
MSTGSPSRRSQEERPQEESNPLAVGDRPHAARRARAGSASSSTVARTPARSFYHRSFHGQLDPPHYSSSTGLRDQTAELAAFALSDNISYLGSSPPSSEAASDDGYIDPVEEVSEPTTPEGSETETGRTGDPAVSRLTMLIHNSAEQDEVPGPLEAGKPARGRPRSSDVSGAIQPDEHTTLLAGDRKPSLGYGEFNDLERQRPRRETYRQQWRKAMSNKRSCLYTVSHPKTWDPKAIYLEVVVHPISLLPAVFLGLLLNILDALSYGMISAPNSLISPSGCLRLSV